MQLAPEVEEPVEARPPRKASLLLSRQEAAKELGVCQRTFDELVYQQLIPTTKIGRRILVRSDELDRFARKRFVRIGHQRKRGAA